MESVSGWAQITTAALVTATVIRLVYLEIQVRELKRARGQNEQHEKDALIINETRAGVYVNGKLYRHPDPVQEVRTLHERLAK